MNTNYLQSFFHIILILLKHKPNCIAQLINKDLGKRFVKTLSKLRKLLHKSIENIFLVDLIKKLRKVLHQIAIFQKYM